MNARMLMSGTSCLVLAGVMGCTVGPDYRRPEVAVPAGFGAVATQSTTRAVAATQPVGLVDLARWWETFGDAQLDGLVRRAVAENLDLKVAEARVREARAQRRVVAADRGLQVNGSGRYQRSRSSENAFSFSGSSSDGGAGGGGGAGNTFGAFNPPGSEADLWQAGFDAAWELDVFGGIRRNVEAAEADVAAQVEARRDTLVSLLAEVAQNYLELRGFQQQIEIAVRNVGVQEDAASVARSRARLAGGSELDVARAEALVASTRSTIPALETLRDQAAYRLGVLVGREPRALVAELEAVRPIAQGPPVVPAGLPSELLRRRPDIRRAERELAAATARVGVATADLYPKFSITAALGFQSEQFRHLADWSSRFWNVAPGVSWSLLDAGRIRANIQVQTERERQALYAYQRSILVALEEVENALTAYAKEQARRELLREAVARNRRAVEVANTLYQGGARDFLNVIDAERALATAEDALVQSERLIATNLVALYKALGGGWTEGEKMADGR